MSLFFVNALFLYAKNSYLVFLIGLNVKNYEYLSVF